MRRIFRGWVRGGTVLGLGLALAIGSMPARADAPPIGSPLDNLPAVLAKDLPEGIEDLKAIQKHVKDVLKKTIPATVGILIPPTQGSGVIITKNGLVLTAGHVSGPAGRDAWVILPDGRRLKAKTLGANRSIDSGMIQIVEKGEFPFVDMAVSNELKKGQWCLAIGHPGGFQKGRSPVVRVGRVLDVGKTYVRTDCALVGGDSGGPLFDMHGRIIGIHSRIGPVMTANIHVPVDTYRDTWDRLAKGEIWGGNPFATLFPTGGAYLGLKLNLEAKDCRVDEVVPDSPAAAAGLKARDVLLMADGKRIRSREDLAQLLQKKRPGMELALEVLRGEEKVSLKVKLGKRPG